MNKLITAFIVIMIISTSTFARRKIKVACVGNSITYGLTLENPEKDSYPAQLQLLLGEGYEVGNFGKSGATLLNKGHRPYMQQEEYRRAVNFAGDIVVIHLGVNDTDPRNWPNYRDLFVKDYLALIDSFRVANPECRVIISRLTPIAVSHYRFESGTRDWQADIQLAIETVARQARVQIVDFHEALYPYPYVYSDAVHPDKDGAALLARKVYSAITGDFGGLHMPAVFSDNMVLQRGRPLDIHGTADAGETVEVSIGNQKETARAGENGKWSVTIRPLKTGSGYTMTVSTAKRRLIYKNVAAGEVWLCSGQSNMEFYLRNSATGKEDVAKSACKDIRLFDMKEHWRTDNVAWESSALDSVNRLQYFRETRWEECSPESAKDFSAVAYYFAKALHDSLKVPVGVICNAVGGSPAEAWIDRGTLENDFPAILRNWTQNDFIQEWVRGRALKNMEKTTAKIQRHPYEPCYLFDAGIMPLEKFPIKGVVWYQGESNAHNFEAHGKLFHLLVDSWRRNWSDSALPFYFVQLSGMDRPSWPWFRNSQLELMRAIPQTGMAVSSDCGDSLNVHPRNKKPVGERLARWALCKTYGKRVVPSGPLARSARMQDGEIYISFDYGNGLRASDGAPLRTFEVAEEDGLYEPAVAEVLETGSVKVRSDKVKSPRLVRYAWQPFTRANLVNADGLPASTFRMEARTSPCAIVGVGDTRILPCADRKFAKGVSACFAGITGGHILVAGGCNFPDKAAKDGGKKRFYSGIYASELTCDSLRKWRKVGALPCAMAYGVAVSVDEGVVCIGGTDGVETMKTVLLIRMNARNAAETEQLPDLPCALDNMSGTAVGRVVYVVGGNKDGVPCNDAYRLDLDDMASGWQRLPDFPGEPRVQPVCAAVNADGSPALYIWGGFAAAHEGREASLSCDGYVFREGSGKWESCPAPATAGGEILSLGGGTAAALSNNLILCMGGVNKDIFLQALRKPAPDYMTHPAEWYRFNPHVMVYDVSRNEWSEVAEMNSVARAGAVLVGNGNRLFYINGELKPGVRTPSVLDMTVEF